MLFTSYLVITGIAMFFTSWLSSRIGAKRTLLIGGLLGSLSWRGPFFGSATLMAVGFVAIVVMLKSEPTRPDPIRVSAPFRALARPGLGVLAAAAFFYNIAFFVLPASPFVAAAAAVLVAVLILLAGHRHLARANGQVDPREEAEAIGAGDS